MYFTKIRLNGLSTVDLPIVNATPSDTYILKDATGLGPPEIDVSIINTLYAGGFYQGRRTQTREIVLVVGLNPDFRSSQTAADLRASLYGMLTPGAIDQVSLEIMNEDTVLVSTIGHIKKLEIAPFSKVPAVQITIACLEQYFQALSDLYLDPGSKTNPSIVNQGTASAGFHMEVVLTSALSGWTLTNENSEKIQVGHAFSIGDTLIIDTRPGLRGVWRKRSGVTTTILSGLTTDSVWLMLHGGTNTFTTSSPAFDWGDVYYKPQYWGI